MLRGIPVLKPCLNLYLHELVNRQGISDSSLHICIFPVYELICKKSISLRYIKLHIDTFVIIIRTVSQEVSILNELGKDNL